MRKILVPRAAAFAAAIAAVLATPALANEARIEGHGGVVWDGSDSDATAGVAVGYDWDLGDSAFVGLETSADKILRSNQRVSVGVGGRAGIKLSEAGKLYAVSSYQTKPCKYCEESVSLGAGYQQNFGSNLYGKVEYRHYFVGNGVPDYDGAVAGLGMRF